MPRRISFLIIISIILLYSESAHSQSLWQAKNGFLFADFKARGVNDIITVLIVETSAASREAETKISKESSSNAGINSFPNIFGIEKYLKDHLRLDVKGESSHQGGGSITRSDKITGLITARIMKVLENGNFLIEGRRSIVVNDEIQFIVISGIIRPEDISGDNTIRSTQVADAEIRYEGRGVLTEKQRPGILNRFLDWLRIF